MELAVVDEGSGIPLVLLHAFPLSSTMWSAQRVALTDVARVLTPDSRGFGRSPQPDGAEPTLDAYADDVAQLLDRAGLDTVVLGGLSMGGYVAMAFARRHPDRLRGLVLADTKAGADPPAAADNRRRIADLLTADPRSTVLVEEILPKLLGTTTTTERPDLVAQVQAWVGAAPAAGAAWAQRAMAARPDSFATLRAVAVPALVVVGEEDELSPVTDAEAMTVALPDADLVTIPGAGHLSAVERPAEFTAALRAFLTTRVR